MACSTMQPTSPMKAKTLSDASQQLGAVKVLGRPCGGVQRVQPGSERLYKQGHWRGAGADQICATAEAQP